MTIKRFIVKRDCLYGDALLLKGDVVYISAAYNFGKQKIFNSNRELIAFCEIDSNNFELQDGNIIEKTI